MKKFILIPFFPMLFFLAGHGYADESKNLEVNSPEPTSTKKAAIKAASNLDYSYSEFMIELKKADSNSEAREMLESRITALTTINTWLTEISKPVIKFQKSFWKILVKSGYNTIKDGKYVSDDTYVLNQNVSRHFVKLLNSDQGRNVLNSVIDLVKESGFQSIRTHAEKISDFYLNNVSLDQNSQNILETNIKKSLETASNRFKKMEEAEEGFDQVWYLYLLLGWMEVVEQQLEQFVALESTIQIVFLKISFGWYSS